MPLAKLAALLSTRNRIDAEIFDVIGRPALSGHIGEFIASHVFDIELERSATTAGFDGRFRSGPLAGRTVNVKLYGKRENLLDIAATHPDWYLVLAGPKQTAQRGTRPLVIHEAFLFEAASLQASLVERGVKIGIATSVPAAAWEAARVFPTPSPSALVLTDMQRTALELFSDVTP